MIFLFNIANNPVLHCYIRPFAGEDKSNSIKIYERASLSSINVSSLSYSFADI